MCRFPSRTCPCRDVLLRVRSLTVRRVSSLASKTARWRTVPRSAPGCWPGFAGCSSSGRALSIEVLDGGLVAPGNLVACQTEGGGDAIALLRGGGPSTQHDRDDPLLGQARALGQLPGVDPVLDAQLLNGLDGVGHGHSPLPCL